MWGRDTKVSKENTGHSYPNISVGAIFNDTARISCGKAVSDWREFDAGHFIPAGSGGFSLLFDERNLNGECPYDNASTEPISYYTGAVSIHDMDPAQRTRLKSAIETVISKEKQRKSGARKNTKPKSSKSRRG